MNEENYTCGICFENYDLKNENKLPKKVTCCNKTFCLSCLNDIYIRNNQQLKCPNCRKITTLPPIYLKNNQLVSSRFLICCNCHEKVPQNQLYFNKINNEILIKCQKCENGDMKLDDILPDFESFPPPVENFFARSFSFFSFFFSVISRSDIFVLMFMIPH